MENLQSLQDMPKSTCLSGLMRYIDVSCQGCKADCRIFPQNIKVNSETINLETGEIVLRYTFDPMTQYCSKCGKKCGTK
jgi:hypothetical protein